MMSKERIYITKLKSENTVAGNILNPMKNSDLSTCVCPVCHKLFRERRNVNKHLRRVHRVEPDIREPKQFCSFDETCQYACVTRTKLREHLKEVHNFEVACKKLQFANYKEFEAWKHEEETNMCVNYVADTGNKVRNGKKIWYQRCHRSGQVRLKSGVLPNKRKRSQPAKGYTQCGITCPAALLITQDVDGSIEVLYHFTHLGHTLDLGAIKYMKLHAKEKDEIAAKIAVGEPIEKILTEAQEKKGRKLSRLNLLKRRDVYYIKSTVNFLEKEVQHDANMLATWVRNMKVTGDDPVVKCKVYESPNEYFVVLIHPIQEKLFSLAFDGSIVYVKTKKAKPNIDYNLISVIVSSMDGIAFPIAHCVSSKSDFTTFSEFYKKIFEVYGTITAEIFVSDNVAHYYLAWRNVMTPCKEKLICTFNIESFWGQKLSELECPADKIEVVRKQLQLLLKGTKREEFESNLIQFLNSWNEDDELRIFAKYFYKFYGKPSEWADCYRLGSPDKENINNYLLPVHDAVENIYLEGIKDLNQGLNSLFRFIRDYCLSYISNYEFSFVSEKLEDIEKSHKQYLDISRIVIKPNGKNWIVNCGDKDHSVSNISRECQQQPCLLHCSSCGLCIHNYSCDCRDYVVNFLLCPHIHAVASAFHYDDTCSLQEDSPNPKIPRIHAVGTAFHYDGSLQEDSPHLKTAALSELRSFENCLVNSTLRDEDYLRIIGSVSKIMEEYFVEAEDQSILKHELDESTLFNMSFAISINCKDSDKHHSSVSSVLHSCDRTISGADDGTVKIWDANLELTQGWEAPAGILSLATVDNHLFACSADEAIHCWDLNTCQHVGKISSTLYQPQKLYSDQTNKVLWAGDAQGNVANYKGMDEIGRYELCEEIWDLLVTNNPTTIFTARDRDVVAAELLIGNKARVMVKATLQGRSPLCRSGRRLCFLNREGRNICVHEDAINQRFPRINEFVASELIINALAGTSDDYIYSGGYDSCVNKWNLNTFKNEGCVNVGCCVNALFCGSENEVYIARSDGIVSKIAP